MNTNYERRRMSCALKFQEIFRSAIPDEFFGSKWKQSASDKRILDAMQKAKLWLDRHRDRTPLDAARIVSSLLREENIAFKRVQR